MTNDPTQNNEHPVGDDVLSEANLWNPLWVYDLFPISQTSWSRMPITGADFETESSQNNEPGNPDESSASNELQQPQSNNPNSSEEPNPNSEENPNNQPDNNISFNNIDDTNEPSNDKHDSDGDRNDNSELSDPARVSYSLKQPENPKPPKLIGLTITETNNTIEYLREFNSWDEFVECVADETLYAWKTIRASHDPNQMTAGASASFPKAVEMARFRGWPEGRQLLSDLTANISTKNEAFEVWGLDVAGIFPIVPAFLSGDPACMIVDPVNELRTQHPIIRIDYNHEVNWFVTPKDMMTRGAAVLSLANNLENFGFQTELRIVGNSTAYDYHSKKTIAFKYSIIYKKPGQFLDIDRAAYAIAHPSCVRRLCFALLEQHEALEPSFKDNYGSPTNKPVDAESGSFGTIFILGSHGNETEEKSRIAVMTAAEATTSALNAAEAGN